MTEQAFTVFNVVRTLILTGFSFLVAILLTPLWTKILLKFRLGKQIRAEGAPVFHEMHQKKEGTPTMGGVVIWVTVILVAFIFWLLSGTSDGFWSKFNFFSRGQTLLPLGAILISAFLGMADDLMGVFRVGSKGGGLSMFQRIILYSLVAIGGAWWFFFKLEFDSINIPFLGDVFVGWWYILIAIFVIVATSFSANETDGLDGLAGGVFLTMFAAYGGIAFVQQRMDLVVLIGVIIGALVAFLWFNIYPARFFMGDTGSMPLGVALGVIAMLTNTIFLLPLIGIIFVLESGSVIVQVLSKKIRKKKVFHSAPIHHHFEAKGWPETQVTMRFWMISAIGALLGLIVFLADSKIPPLWQAIF
ncbi:MAG: phospho-N-acetylmuramoyl-pentapeptide-transferase [Candidatus Yanofskybacteria bacterium CG10_big_fil_rev_8_21_14_0_10_46_23]|uniref:Phospho-N-acetylmuramoyl-pentapeptide-transferase n=1 Tax=Candidatus Yanofskybacteria bacterium CG10_big_fil_rev_8_21_14_0_10_46_23 TaxID=1975098 RepID=A0A2H0R4G1_9BACT|nr:MAG: phospho-N-acetylmuramoyl-pentapeptide-transferase [Candidatus Yanofskybacteria bacterium CG10_big_fil_rev_8_21_14_0_10_46_23]